MDLAALADCSASFESEPLNAVLISAREPIDCAHCLAILPPEADATHLYRILHAALAQPDTPAPTSSWLTDKRRWQPRRVLVAEDNRINQQVIERMLQTAGHAVTLVGNGEQALDALEADTFDVVLMDVNMPVMDGLDAVKLHRFATSGRDPTPFVALTADATDETRRQCDDAGVAAFLTKPVDMEELLALIDRLACPKPPISSSLAAKSTPDLRRRRHETGARSGAPRSTTSARRPRRFPPRPDPRFHRRRRATGRRARSSGSRPRCRHVSRSRACVAQQCGAHWRHRRVRTVPRVARHRARRSGCRRRRLRDAAEVRVRTSASCPHDRADRAAAERASRNYPTALSRSA